MNDAITPFTLAVPQADLEDLNRRIDQTRWPDAETVDDWTQGAPLAKVKALVDHWRHRYDWRRCEAMLNDWGQYKTTVDGLDIHSLHVRSKHENALPLIITHAWPGSVIEFMKIIGPLTDPTAHGGKAKDAFHVIVPSLPGHGFSDKAFETGWGIPQIAAAWITLMRRLGYRRWVAQGGDWGSVVTTAIGVMKPDDCAAIHSYKLDQPPMRGFASNNIPGFWLKNGEVAKDLYVAFTAKSADAVRASYKAAIDAGATSNKEPSLRPEWRADYFAANIGDPDGYNIEIAYKPWLYK